MKSKAATAHPPFNPYLNSKREWNECYGSYIDQARNWRYAAVFALLVALVSAAGLVHVASQSQVVPYIVQVDKLGQAVTVERAGTPFKPDNPLIIASLARWVAALRSVYTDAGAMRVLLKEGYSMVNERSEAFARLNDYMRTHDPFERARTETITVSVASVQPLSADSWRIEWQEETRDRGGGQGPKVQQWQATVTVVFSPPVDEQSIRLNPIGMYINNFNWSQRL